MSTAPKGAGDEGSRYVPLWVPVVVLVALLVIAATAGLVAAHIVRGGL
jgi:hypothetical protein